MKVLPTDNDKESALNSLINQSQKHRCLMALAGSIDELSADKMLNEIKQSRCSRGSRKNQGMLK